MHCWHLRPCPGEIWKLHVEAEPDLGQRLTNSWGCTGGHYIGSVSVWHSWTQSDCGVTLNLFSMLWALVSPVTRQMGTLQFQQCSQHHTIVYITLLTSLWRNSCLTIIATIIASSLLLCRWGHQSSEWGSQLIQIPMLIHGGGKIHNQIFWL